MLVNSGVYLYHTTWTWWNKHPQADGIPEKLVAHKTFPGDRPSLPWKLREDDGRKMLGNEKKGTPGFRLGYYGGLLKLSQLYRDY